LAEAAWKSRVLRGEILRLDWRQVECDQQGDDQDFGPAMALTSEVDAFHLSLLLITWFLMVEHSHLPPSLMKVACAGECANGYDIFFYFNGADAPVLYADGLPSLVGLDQINLRLLRSLIGRGEVDVVLTVDGKTSNTLRINVK